MKTSDHPARHQTVRVFGRLAGALMDRLAEAFGALASPKCEGFVVCLYDASTETDAHRLNVDLVARGTPGLFVRLSPARIDIMPAGGRGSHPCLMCFALREMACRAHSDLPDEEEDRPGSPGDGLSTTLIGTATRHVSELLRSLAEGSAAQNGATHLVEVNWYGDSRHHPVLRRGDCPVCGSVVRHDSTRPSESDGGNRLNEVRERLAEALISHRTGVVTRIDWIPDRDDASESLFVCGATLANSLLEPESAVERCYGKGRTAAEAMESALGEAVERYAAVPWQGNALRRARRAELPRSALLPGDLVLDDIDGTDHISDVAIDWTEVTSALSARRWHVPANHVFLTYPPHDHTDLLTPVTSTGLAAAPEFERALLAGILEVIERHAFVRAWEGRIPGSVVNWDEHPDPFVREFAHRETATGATPILIRLENDLPAEVFAAVLLDERAVPALSLGLGAGLRASEAATRAILEAGQVRRVLSQRLTLPHVVQRLLEVAADERAVTSAEDHVLRYALPATIAPARFLWSAPVTRLDWDATPRQPATLDGLLRSLSDCGYDALYRDLTPPEIREIELRVVRVLIPGTHALRFGYPRHRRSRNGDDRSGYGRAFNAHVHLFA